MVIDGYYRVSHGVGAGGIVCLFLRIFMNRFDVTGVELANNVYRLAMLAVQISLSEND